MKKPRYVWGVRIDWSCLADVEPYVGSAPSVFATKEAATRFLRNWCEEHDMEFLIGHSDGSTRVYRIRVRSR